METTTKVTKAGGRVDFTPEELRNIRVAAEKAADEKIARMRASHPPEYWERFWEALRKLREERRMRLL